jgi:single-strand selective monofunctional uracil DNA glycosylase
MSLSRISRRLCRTVDALAFAPPVAFTYNPLAYARGPHEAYLERWGAGQKEVVLLGMNPGPFGMAQTGVPFGDVTMVRDFLQVDGRVGAPPREHPKRPIQGFACPRSEVSGTRLWGWARDRFGSPERFFARFFVVNYCPLVFMGDSGKNITPDKLPPDERRPLFEACDDALAAVVRELDPEWVVGIGAFARKRAEAVAGDRRVGVVLHPSPASPRANRGWATEVERDFAALGIDLG